MTDSEFYKKKRRAATKPDSPYAQFHYRLRFWRFFTLQGAPVDRRELYYEFQYRNVQKLIVGGYPVSGRFMKKQIESSNV